MTNLYHPVKIGNVTLQGNLFLAPVAGYSDAAFRSVCVENGAAFTYTEMVSAEALVRKNLKTEILMKRAYNEKAYSVQIFGGEPGIMSEATKIVLDKAGPEVIDINCGCPVPKIVKTGAGSALTRDPDRLYKVAKAVVDSAAEWCGGSGDSGVSVGAAEGGEACSSPVVGVATAGLGKVSAATGGISRPSFVPVTVKIRSGWESKVITWKEAAQAALEAGVSAITIHPRTRAQGYEGFADWTIMKDLVDFVAAWCKEHGRGTEIAGSSPAMTEDKAQIMTKIPVFGSGDLFKPEDAKRMLEETGVDAIMFARGAMGNPFIFRDATSLLQTGSYQPVPPEERVKTGFEELLRLIDETEEAHACREMRKRFSAYSKGISGGAALRAKIVHAESFEDYKEIFSDFYK